MEFDPTEDIFFPPGTETITIAFHGQNPITKHPILISYHLKVPADYVRLQFLKTRDSRGRHPRQRNLQYPSVANTSSPLGRLNNITLGALFSELRYNLSYQQVEHIRIEPASTASSKAAVTAPTARLLSAATSSDLIDSIQSAPTHVNNGGSSMIDGVASSVPNPQLPKAKPPPQTLAKEQPHSGNGSSVVSVVIPSTPSAPKSAYPRTRSQSRKPQGDDSSCSSSDVTPSGSSRSANRNPVLHSSPPTSSPPSAHLHKDSPICDACPVCKRPGELFKIKGQGFVWCDKHSNQSPVLRSSISKDADGLNSRDDRTRRTPKKSAFKSKAPVSTTTTTQSSSGKVLKHHDSRKTSKKRDRSPVEFKRKRRHMTPDEDSSFESI
ncbi:hypothetical protein MMC18_004994 [Xylographa bjoerkii]|nr:hypothetical protein [Xylographa bjoerkii]